MELKEQELSHEDVVKNLKKVSVTIVFYILAHVNIQKVLDFFTTGVWLYIVSITNIFWKFLQGHDEHVTKLRQDFERQVKGEWRELIDNSMIYFFFAASKASFSNVH